MNDEVWRPELLSQYEDSPDVIYVVDSALNITYCNKAWDRFALNNGGSLLLRKDRIGCNIVEITPPVLRPFYADLYERVLGRGEETGHVYECSAPETSRLFHMHLTRKTVRNQGSWLVIINSLVREETRQHPRWRTDLDVLREPNGLITMCSHCRRTRIPNAGESWVWIQDLVRAMPREVSHGLCPVCFDIHYGGIMRAKQPAVTSRPSES
jgi:PAS domain-containing protein